jgi:hypothetical protein
MVVKCVAKGPFVGAGNGCGLDTLQDGAEKPTLWDQLKQSGLELSNRWQYHGNIRLYSSCEMAERDDPER